MEPVTIPEANVYEILGRKEVLIQSLMLEIQKLKARDEGVTKMHKTMWGNKKK